MPPHTSLILLIILFQLSCVYNIAQEPHYKNGHHNPNYKHDDQKDLTIEELAESCWNNGMFTASDLWEGEKEILTVKDGFENSNGERVGFVLSFANVVALETSEGIVLFDSSSFLTGSLVRNQILNWSSIDKLNTLVYTHGHYDHVFGANEWVENQEEIVQIVAHSNLPNRFDRYKLTNEYNTRINLVQFDDAYGKKEALSVDFPTNFIYPTVLYENNFNLNIGGEPIELYHAKGETDDATWIWLPRRKIVVTGDLFIWHSPNAGNPQKVQRYPKEWANALREIKEKKPEFLLPGHGPPIIGNDRINEALENTAQYLEIIFDQTIKMINEGRALNYIIHNINYPTHLHELPYLTPTYDEPEFIVRNIWRKYAGWWDGNPANLKPASDVEISEEIVNLVGSVHAIAVRAMSLADQGKYEVASHLAQIAYDASPEDPLVKRVMANVFGRRSTDPSTTSLMAKSIYNSVATKFGNYIDETTPIEELNIFQRAYNAFSYVVLGKSFHYSTGLVNTGVPASLLDYENLEKVLSAPPTDSYSKYQSDIERANNDFDKYLNEDIWTLQKESNGVQTFMGTFDDSDLTGVRGITTIDFSPRVIAAFLVDPLSNRRVDSRTTVEYLEGLGNGATIQYRSVAGKLMISGRDFYVVTKVFYNESKNSYRILMTSINDDNYSSQEPEYGYVRGEVIVGGLEILPGNNNNSIVTYLSVTDLGGSLPNKVKTLIAQVQTAILGNLKECILDN
eukprot:TRINITY_DN141_c0_g1_i1.p1 TRINITY_DN141_c0_g1~~TRINITY_DN141_c0_g1_i1.p1  ORF type:complete len:738 (+),score=286.09 TRINITY_DN141_c0_g1_i1:54-2267(+)